MKDVIATRLHLGLDQLQSPAKADNFAAAAAAATSSPLRLLRPPTA
jgi:hypothetical protein